jgi:hypothetical protein
LLAVLMIKKKKYLAEPRLKRTDLNLQNITNIFLSGKGVFKLNNLV